ncbi:hypothetical protein [Gordonia phthalatica]|uniref:hypothetical protein n=1 Tax=Gordonia phthalatica TaxID=1136941 RepID=UPI0012FE9F39|nr:hypothetical protein [Gordonia phthalatica]
MILRSLFTRVAPLSAALGVAFGGIVACGSGSESPPPETSQTVAVESACDRVTTEQVVATTGVAPDAAKPGLSKNPGVSTCYWSKAGKTLLSLATFTAPADVKATERELKSGLFYDEKALSPGIGDSSFFRLAGHNEAAVLVFRKGPTLYVLTARNQGDGQVTVLEEQAARLKLASLARQIG